MAGLQHFLKGNEMSAAKILAAALALAALPSCAPAPNNEPPASAAPAPATSLEPALVEAHQALHDALSSRDVEGVVSLLDPSPNLLIFPPLVEERFDSLEDVRSKLPEMFERFGEATWTEVHAEAVRRGDVGWITSNLLIESRSLTSPFIGRGTEIWVKTQGRWRLVHAHWSEAQQRAHAAGSLESAEVRSDGAG